MTVVAQLDAAVDECFERVVVEVARGSEVDHDVTSACRHARERPRQGGRGEQVDVTTERELATVAEEREGRQFLRRARERVYAGEVAGALVADDVALVH